MDVLTPRGAKTLEQEARAAYLIAQQFPQLRYIHTPKDRPARVDAMLCKGDDIHRVIETKCRTCTLHKFQNDYGNEWILTQEKLESSRRIALELGVPLAGFLYLVPDDVLLVQQLTDANGLYKVKIRVEATKTQRTVNGGHIIRNNAFINMSAAHVIYGA